MSRRPPMIGETRWLYWHAMQGWAPVKVLRLVAGDNGDASDRYLVEPRGAYYGRPRLVPAKKLYLQEDVIAEMERRRARPALPSLKLGQTWSDRRDPFIGRVVEIDAESKTATLRCVREPQRSVELPLSAWTEPGRMKLVGNAPAEKGEDDV